MKLNLMKMKKILVLALFIAGFVFTSVAQDNTKIKWYSIEEVAKLNEENPRKVFIDLYTDWCGWCKKLDQTTFIDPVIVELLNSEFYAVKFNAESKDPISFGGKTFVNEGGKSRNPHQLAVAMLQGQMSYPSAAYMDEDLQLLTAVPGYLTAKDLEPILNFFANDSYKNGVTYQDFLKTFEGKVQ